MLKFLHSRLTTPTKNFQSSNLGLQKAEEEEINLPTFSVSYRKKGDFRKAYTSVSVTTLKLLTVCIINKLWKAIQEMKILDYFTCLLRNQYTNQEATVRTLYWTTDWFRIDKGEWQGCLLSSCWFNLYAESIMRNARLIELQARIYLFWSQCSKSKCQLREGGRVGRKANYKKTQTCVRAKQHTSE